MGKWFRMLKKKYTALLRNCNGADSLSLTMQVMALLLLLIYIPVTAKWLLWVALALFVCSLYRYFSKDLSRRQAENEAYLHLIKPVQQWKRLSLQKWKDRKTHCYFRCPKCGHQLRIPKGAGKVTITCSNCNEQFMRES